MPWRGIRPWHAARHVHWMADTTNLSWYIQIRRHANTRTHRTSEFGGNAVSKQCTAWRKNRQERVHHARKRALGTWHRFVNKATAVKVRINRNPHIHPPYNNLCIYACHKLCNRIGHRTYDTWRTLALACLRFLESHPKHPDVCFYRLPPM